MCIDCYLLTNDLFQLLMVPYTPSSLLCPEVMEIHLPQSLLHLLYSFLHLHQLLHKLPSYLIYLIISSTILLFYGMQFEDLM